MAPLHKKPLFAPTKPDCGVREYSFHDTLKHRIVLVTALCTCYCTLHLSQLLDYHKIIL